MGSVVVVSAFICSMVCEIFPDQGLNLCPLHWRADSYPLHHQASPDKGFIVCLFLQTQMELVKMQSGWIRVDSKAKESVPVRDKKGDTGRQAT